MAADTVTLADFAAEQAEYIKLRLQIVSDAELAQVNVVKLAEETGEVANAFLALRGMQRDAKLQGSDQDRLAALAKEIGDVVATVAVLAHAVGLDIDRILAVRMMELTERRQQWLDAQEPAPPTGP